MGASGIPNQNQRGHRQPAGQEEPHWFQLFDAEFLVAQREQEHTGESEDERLASGPHKIEQERPQRAQAERARLKSPGPLEEARSALRATISWPLGGRGASEGGAHQERACDEQEHPGARRVQRRFERSTSHPFDGQPTAPERCAGNKLEATLPANGAPQEHGSQHTETDAEQGDKEALPSCSDSDDAHELHCAQHRPEAMFPGELEFILHPTEARSQASRGDRLDPARRSALVLQSSTGCEWIVGWPPGSPSCWRRG